MTLRDVLRAAAVDEIRVTFDDDPKDGEIDFVIYGSVRGNKILVDKLLDKKVFVVDIIDNALIVCLDADRDSIDVNGDSFV